MNKAPKTILIIAALMLTVGATPLRAQSKNSEPRHYKDMVTENVDAEADITLVNDYVHTLVAGDVDKAIAMLSSNYIGYGPGPDDSASAKQTGDSWKQSNAMQSNRKVSCISETFNVKSGDLAGHWVSTWGTYSFTQNGKDVKFPYQYTAHVKNGKIDQDRIYYDQLSILKALGYTVTPPAK